MRSSGPLFAAGLLAVAALAGCDRGAGQIAGRGTRPAIQTAVGPQPGTPTGAVAAGNPFVGDLAATTEGRKLFLWFNCAGCHGDHAGGGMGPSLRDVDWIYGNTDAQIFSSIAEGRANGMPAWGTKLNQDQIWKLVAYIRSLRTRNEPDPPPENLSWPAPRTRG